jgi:predicted nucleic acid-binding protein
MQKVFIDTNIILDLLEKRESFYKDAQELFTLADQKKVKLYVSALSIANIHYLLERHLKMEARKVISKFKLLVNILVLDDKIIELSLASDFADFEDAIQYYTALENNINLIITRNNKDFKHSKLPILSTKEFLNL